MLIKIIFQSRARMEKVKLMSSFEIYAKSSCEMVNKKLEIVKRKKQALDDLFNKGRISQMTHEYVAKDLDDSINEMEGQQKVLADRITSKISELEDEIRTLEMFLANLAIGHAAGEVTDSIYKNESRSLVLGLENAKRELSNLRDTLLGIIPGEVEAPVEELIETEVSEAAAEETEAPMEETVEAPAVEEEAQIEEASEDITEEMPTEEDEVYFEAPSEDVETSAEEIDITEETEAE